MPVRRRLLVDAVSVERVPAALGFDNATMYATRALGPLLGGATYQVLGISGIYALDRDELPRLPSLGGARHGLFSDPKARAIGAQPTGFPAAAAAAGFRSALPDHHGCDTRLQPLVLAIHRHGPGYRAEGFRAHAGPGWRPVGL